MEEIATKVEEYEYEVLKESYPWACILDKLTNSIYYYNYDNGTTQFEAPNEFNHQIETQNSSIVNISNEANYLNTITSELREELNKVRLQADSRRIKDNEFLVRGTKILEDTPNKYNLRMTETIHPTSERIISKSFDEIIKVTNPIKLVVLGRKRNSIFSTINSSNFDLKYKNPLNYSTQKMVIFEALSSVSDSRKITYLDDEFMKDSHETTSKYDDRLVDNLRCKKFQLKPVLQKENKQLSDYEMFELRLQLLINEGNDPNYAKNPSDIPCLQRCKTSPGNQNRKSNSKPQNNSQITSSQLNFRPSTTGSVIARSYNFRNEKQSFKVNSQNHNNTSIEQNRRDNIDPEALFNLMEKNQNRKERNKEILAQLILIFTILEDDNECISNYSVSKGSKTWIEEGVTKKHLLDAAMLQRQQIVMPIGCNEISSYCTNDQSHLFCPENISAKKLIGLFKQLQKDQKLDGRLKVLNFKDWKIYSLVDFETGQQRYRWYINQTCNIVQTGDPFDLKHLVIRDKLFQEEESIVREYEHIFSKMDQNHILLCDEKEGYLFYDKMTQTYLCPIGRQNASVGNALTSTLGKNTVKSDDRNNQSKFRSSNVKEVYKIVDEMIAEKTKIRTKTSLKTSIEAEESDKIYEYHKSIIPKYHRHSENEKSIWSKLILGRHEVKTIETPRVLHLSRSKTPKTSNNTRLPLLSSSWDSGIEVKPQNLLMPKSSFQSSLSELGIISVEPNISNFPIMSHSCISNQKDVDISKLLDFEKHFRDEDYIQYCDLLQSLRNDSQNLSHFLNLTIFFLKKGKTYGEFALLCVKLGLQSIASLDCSSTLISLLNLLIHRLKSRFKHEDQPVASILSEVSSCPESDHVLFQASICFRQLGCYNLSEKLLIAGLLINPYNSIGLHQYANLVAEKYQQFKLARKYLLRIRSDSLLYPRARLEIVWLHELQQKSDDVIFAAYNNFNSIDSKRKEKVMSAGLRSIGHFYHIKGMQELYKDYYLNANKMKNSDPVSNILLACTTVKSPDERDSLFRRALVLLPKNNEKSWIALLATADLISSHVQDYRRVETLLWESFRKASSTEVWPGIALAHYYQYVRNDPKTGLKVLLFVCKKRRCWFRDDSQNPECILDSYRNHSNHQNNNHQSEDPLNQFLIQERERLNNNRDKNENTSKDLSLMEQIELASLLTAIGYCLFELNRFEEASHIANTILTIKNTFSPAHRLIGEILHSQPNISSKSLRFQFISDGFISGITKDIRFASPYFLRSYSMYQSLTNENKTALETMKLATQISGNSPLAWRALGWMKYLYGGLNENRSVVIEDCLQCLTSAINLSRYFDTTALKLKGQILLENGKYSEAEGCFQLAINRTPHDSVALVGYALATYGLNLRRKFERSVINKHPNKSSSSDDSIDSFDMQVEGLSNPEIDFELNSVERLFQRAMTACPQISGDSLELNEKIPELTVTKFGEKNCDSTNTQDKMCKEEEHEFADIHFFYGTYQLKLSSHFIGIKRSTYLTNAKMYFNQSASSNSDIRYIAIFMLGWIEDICGNLVGAGKFYNEIIDAEYINPHRVLQLIKLSEQAIGCIGRPEDFIDMTNNGINMQFLFPRVSSSVKRGYLGQEYRKIYDPISLFDLTMELPTDSFESDCYLATERLDHSKRISLHHHVYKRLLQRKMILEATGEIQTHWNAPSRYISTDRYWKTKLFNSFKRCDDWAWLLSCGNMAD